MERYRFLRQRFYAENGGLFGDVKGRLEASADSAVMQFKGHLNSVGFLPLFTCPGATNGEGGCSKVCYARNGRSNMPNTLRRQVWNTHILFQYCDALDMEGLLDEFLFLIDHARRQFDNRLAKLSKTSSSTEYRRLLSRGPLFRFQWGGDLVHPIQAMAMREAARRRPEVTMWAYTRSFSLLKHLSPPPQNLRIWISVDDVNREEAMEYHEKFPWTDLAEMTETRPQKSILCPKYGHSAKENRGVCARCGMCFSGRAGHIWFPVKRYVGERENPLLEINELE